jgi:hypothetical protein
MAKFPMAKKKLKDGYYIEIRNKGSKTGTIIGRETKELMYRAAKLYEISKDVIILGSSKDGTWVSKFEGKESE